MTENTGFASFLLFNAIKMHFTSKYDYFKYSGKLKLTQDHFLNHKNKYYFYRLSRRFSLEDLRDFYVSNFLVDSIHWVGDITNEDGDKNYKEWQKRIQSLSYNFENDLDKLFDKVDNPNDLLKVDDDQPLLLTHLMRNDITIETVVILNDILSFIPMWSKKIDDDIIWPMWKQRIIKYTPFLEYDKPKFKKILKEKINEKAKD